MKGFSKEREALQQGVVRLLIQPRERGGKRHSPQGVQQCERGADRFVKFFGGEERGLKWARRQLCGERSRLLEIRGRSAGGQAMKWKGRTAGAQLHPTEQEQTSSTSTSTSKGYRIESNRTKNITNPTRPARPRCTTRGSLARSPLLSRGRSLSVTGVEMSYTQCGDGAAVRLSVTWPRCAPVQHPGEHAKNEPVTGSASAAAANNARLAWGGWSETGRQLPRFGGGIREVGSLHPAKHRRPAVTGMAWPAS